MMADIDECAGSNKCGCQYNDGICKSTCTNTDGSYNCQCSKGYYKNSAELCEGMFHRFFLQDYGLMRSKPLRGIKVLTTEFLFLLDTEYVVFQFLNSKLCEILLNTFPGECLTLQNIKKYNIICLLYTSPSPRDATLSRMPSSA